MPNVVPVLIMMLLDFICPIIEFALCVCVCVCVCAHVKGVNWGHSYVYTPSNRGHTGNRGRPRLDSCLESTPQTQNVPKTSEPGDPEFVPN